MTAARKPSMTPAAYTGTTTPLVDPAPRDVGENGYTDYGLRLVDGVAMLVVVGMGFIVHGLETEAFDVERFEQRMRHFAGTLTDQMQHQVVRLKVYRRTGKRPWAEFEILTPAYYLPIPIGPTEN